MLLPNAPIQLSEEEPFRQIMMSEFAIEGKDMEYLVA